MARLSERQRDFAARAYEAARAAGLSGVQADLAVSQAIHESAWGTRPSGTNNVHGIKGKGSSVQTHEIVNGRRVNQRASFRNFGSLTDSFRAWKSLMERSFKAVMKADTLPEAVRALKAGKQGGYATDPKYDNKVKAIANTITRAPLPPPSLVAGLGNVPLPSSAPLMGRMAQAPIPPNLPSVARPDNRMAAGPTFARQIATASRAPLQAPSSERFGGRSSAPLPAPTMAGFAPDPSRFGRQAMPPASPARGGRVGTGAFSAPPDPARFGPPASAPLQAPRMAPGPVDPARFGQVPVAHQMPAAPVNRSVEPSNPGQLGGIRMSNPVGLGGPGGLMLPQAAPAPVGDIEPLAIAPEVAPVAAPPLSPPRTVQPRPIMDPVQAPPAPPSPPPATPMDVYRGMAPTAMSASGNRVSADQFGNTAVTNRFGATTVMTPNGQAFGGLSSSPISGPLGNAGIEKPEEGRFGFGGLKTVAGGLTGAKMGGMVGGLPGLAIGGLLGGLFGRELAKPGGGMFANSPIGGLLGNAVNDGLVRNSVLGNTGGGSPSFVNEGRMPTRREYEALGVTFREGDRSSQADRARNSVGLY